MAAERRIVLIYELERQQLLLDRIRLEPELLESKGIAEDAIMRHRDVLSDHLVSPAARAASLAASTQAAEDRDRIIAQLLDKQPYWELRIGDLAPSMDALEQISLTRTCLLLLDQWAREDDFEAAQQGLRLAGEAKHHFHAQRRAARHHALAVERQEVEGVLLSENALLAAQVGELEQRIKYAEPDAAEAALDLVEAQQRAEKATQLLAARREEWSLRRAALSLSTEEESLMRGIVDLETKRWHLESGMEGTGGYLFELLCSAARADCAVDRCLTYRLADIRAKIAAAAHVNVHRAAATERFDSAVEGVQRVLGDLQNAIANLSTPGAAAHETARQRAAAAAAAAADGEAAAAAAAEKAEQVARRELMARRSDLLRELDQRNAALALLRDHHARVLGALGALTVSLTEADRIVLRYVGAMAAAAAETSNLSEKRPTVKATLAVSGAKEARRLIMQGANRSHDDGSGERDREGGDRKDDVAGMDFEPPDLDAASHTAFSQTMAQVDGAEYDGGDRAARKADLVDRRVRALTHHGREFAGSSNLLAKSNAGRGARPMAPSGRGVSRGGGGGGGDASPGLPKVARSRPRVTTAGGGGGGLVSAAVGDDLEDSLLADFQNNRAGGNVGFGGLQRSADPSALFTQLRVKPYVALGTPTEECARVRRGLRARPPYLTKAVKLATKELAVLKKRAATYTYGLYGGVCVGAPRQQGADYSNPGSLFQSGVAAAAAAAAAAAGPTSAGNGAGGDGGAASPGGGRSGDLSARADGDDGSGTGSPSGGGGHADGAAHGSGIPLVEIERAETPKDSGPQVIRISPEALTKAQVLVAKVFDVLKEHPGVTAVDVVKWRNRARGSCGMPSIPQPIAHAMASVFAQVITLSAPAASNNGGTASVNGVSALNTATGGAGGTAGGAGGVQIAVLGNDGVPIEATFVGGDVPDPSVGAQGMPPWFQGVAQAQQNGQNGGGSWLGAPAAIFAAAAAAVPSDVVDPVQPAVELERLLAQNIDSDDQLPWEKSLPWELCRARETATVRSAAIALLRACVTHDELLEERIRQVELRKAREERENEELQMLVSQQQESKEHEKREAERQEAAALDAGIEITRASLKELSRHRTKEYNEQRLKFFERARSKPIAWAMALQQERLMHSRRVAERAAEREQEMSSRLRSAADAAAIRDQQVSEPILERLTDVMTFGAIREHQHAAALKAVNHRLDVLRDERLRLREEAKQASYAADIRRKRRLEAVAAAAELQVAACASLPTTSMLRGAGFGALGDGGGGMIPTPQSTPPLTPRRMSVDLQGAIGGPAEPLAMLAHTGLHPLPPPSARSPSASQPAGGDAAEGDGGAASGTGAATSDSGPAAVGGRREVSHLMALLASHPNSKELIQPRLRALAPPLPSVPPPSHVPHFPLGEKAKEREKEEAAREKERRQKTALLAREKAREAERAAWDAQAAGQPPTAAAGAAAAVVAAAAAPPSAPAGASGADPPTPEAEATTVAPVVSAAA